MSRSLLPRLGALLLAACTTPGPDAYGTFEATEVTVAAETGGRLLAVAAEEGQPVARGALLAVVDTGPLVLQRAELRARRASTEARGAEALAQKQVVEAQRDVAQREYERTARLAESQAATAQQADRATRDVRTLEAQAHAADATHASLGRDLAGVDAQLAQVADKIARSRVAAPLAGTVLARLVEPGELVNPGTPVARLAALDTLVLRAYVAGNQLSRVALGRAVTVRVDAPNGGLDSLPGIVSWISASAEFTPTPIQTREERTTQVYAVKVRVANPAGRLRIGMPGELVLPAAK